jgi:2-phospho-L-lactate guanylyltransferase
MAAIDMWAVVPVKETQYAKQRLAESLTANLRPGFALAMLEDVLGALTAARGLAGIIVVTADPLAAEIARRHNARILVDEAHGGHTAVIQATARRLAREGRGGMLQVPGDIPLVTADEISLLLLEHRNTPAFTIVPSHDEFGSNAVLVSPPDAVPLTFGDDSFFPHLNTARKQGVEPLIMRLPGIGRDIDRPEDIRAFADLRSDTCAQAFLNQNDFVGLCASQAGADAGLSRQGTKV